MKKSKAVIGVLCGILAVALVVASVMVQIYGGRRRRRKARNFRVKGKNPSAAEKITLCIILPQREKGG